MDSGSTAVLAPSGDLNRPAGWPARFGRALTRFRRTAARTLRHPEPWLVLVLAAATFVVHDVAYALRVPFWTDESWVAVTTRFPLGQLPAVTSSTPIGWSALLRLLAIGSGGRQWLRVLPLVFCALTVAVSYLFAGGLGWRDRRSRVLAGTLAAVMVLFSPALLVRDDLKQYTADACLALGLLAALSRLERDWSRRRLAELVTLCFAGMLFSHTTLFVAVAAFGALALLQAARRTWARLVETAVAGLAAGAVMGLVYALFDARAVVSGLTSYWDAYYVPLRQGPAASLRFLRYNLGQLHAYIGLGPTWLIALLAVLGLIVPVRVARPAVALAIVLLGPEMIVVSGLRKYPLLDERTSTFLLVILVALAAIGIAGLCDLIASKAASGGGQPAGARGAWTVTGPALAVVAASIFVAGSRHDIRTHDLPNEDVRSQATYVYAHRAPDDVVLVNLNGNWGFAYYWKQGTPAQSPSTAVLQKYLAVFPDQPQIVVAGNRDAAGVRNALDRALAQARSHPGARIWVIRIHVTLIESDAWAAALRADHVALQPVGGAGLAVISPAG